MGNLVICTPFFPCHLSQPVYDISKLGNCFFHQGSILENDYQASIRSIEQQEWDDCTTPVNEDGSAQAQSGTHDLTIRAGYGNTRTRIHLNC